MKKWETKAWWESRNWAKEDIEAMGKEELGRLEKQPWFESGKPCETDVFHQRDWKEEFEAIWGKWGCHGIGKFEKVALSLPNLVMRPGRQVERGRGWVLELQSLIKPSVFTHSGTSDGYREWRAKVTRGDKRGGWAGKLLRIDLSSGQIQEELLSDKLAYNLLPDKNGKERSY